MEPIQPNTAGLGLLSGLLSIPARMQNQRQDELNQQTIMQAFNANQPIPTEMPQAPQVGGSGTFGKILSGVGGVGAALSGALGNPVPPPRLDIGKLSNMINMQETAQKRKYFGSAADALAQGDTRAAGISVMRAGSPGTAAALYGKDAPDIKTPIGAVVAKGKKLIAQGKLPEDQLPDFVIQGSQEIQDANSQRIQDRQAAVVAQREALQAKHVQEGQDYLRKAGLIPGEPGGATPAAGATPKDPNAMQPASVHVPVGGGASVTLTNPNADKGSKATQDVLSEVRRNAAGVRAYLTDPEFEKSISVLPENKPGAAGALETGAGMAASAGHFALNWSGDPRITYLKSAKSNVIEAIRSLSAGSKGLRITLPELKIFGEQLFNPLSRGTMTQTEARAARDTMLKRMDQVESAISAQTGQPPPDQGAPGGQPTAPDGNLGDGFHLQLVH